MKYIVKVVDGSASPARCYEFTSYLPARRAARKMCDDGYIGGRASVYEDPDDGTEPRCRVTYSRDE